MAKRVTINMIAEAAGVSRGTVDRVLNQRPHVKPDVYERVVKAMRELGYQPIREEQSEAFGLLGEPERNKISRIGIILTSEGGYFEDEIRRGIEDAEKLIKGYGVEILIRKCSTSMTDEVIENIEGLLREDIKGLALCVAVNHQIISEKIDEISDSGIPVITFNSDIEDSKRLCYIGQDVIKSGRVAGDLMAKLIKPGAEILAAVGNKEMNAHKLRFKGFCDRLDELGYDSKKIRVIETYNDYAVTYKKVMEALEENPDIEGIYMCNHSVSGCVEAVKTLNRKGKQRIICHDVTESTRRLLKQDEIDFTIAQDLYQQGNLPPILLWEYMNGRSMSMIDAQHIDILCSQNISV